MSDEKKPLSTKNKVVTTGGLGAVLTTLVPAIISDPTNPWRPVLYALAPILSAALIYIGSWLINRHGLESPAEAALRNSLEREIKEIDKELESTNISPALRKKLLTERESAVLQKVSIGRKFKVSAAHKVEED